MTKGPATESTLGELHQKVAQVMINALDNVSAAQEVYDPTLDMPPPEVNPALLSVAVRFLDANKITCAPEAGNAMSDLEQRLAEKRNRKRVGNVVHLHDE